MRGIYKMLNKVGREIPEEILKQTGKEVFREIITKITQNFRNRVPLQKL